MIENPPGTDARRHWPRETGAASCSARNVSLNNPNIQHRSRQCIGAAVDAFDKAWESVQASEAIFDTDAAAEIARTILATHIIEAAKQGERDQGRLRDGALVSFNSLKSAKCAGFAAVQAAAFPPDRRALFSAPA